MKNPDVEPAHLNGYTAEARERERKDKSNLRTIRITVRAQTVFHLAAMASSLKGGKDLGRAVDKLVREHQVSQRIGEAGAYERPD